MEAENGYNLESGQQRIFVLSESAIFSHRITVMICYDMKGTKQVRHILLFTRLQFRAGLFTWREEERRRNFSFALHAEISTEELTKWRRKRRITVGLEQLNARLSPCSFFLSLVLGSSERTVVYMVLGSSYLSARKFLSLGRY